MAKVVSKRATQGEETPQKEHYRGDIEEWIKLGFRLDSVDKDIKLLVENNKDVATKVDLDKFEKDIKASINVRKEALDKLEKEIKASLKETKEAIEKLSADINLKFTQPREGIYSKLQDIETWKATTTKVLWMLVTLSIGLFAATLKKTLVG